MITAHTLIKNEENFIWYSVMSVIDYVDKVLIWDTGSTDLTRKIIKFLIKKYPNKISYREIGEVNAIKYSEIRQKMLDVTATGWIMILDGDEIWWKDSIKKVTDRIRKDYDEVNSIVVPTVNLVGDIFHYQEEKAGRYNFNGRIGHYSIRFINCKIPGLRVTGDYPLEAFVDANNVPIQNRKDGKMIFINASYLHATHVIRSSYDQKVMQRKRKLKYELGIPFSEDFYYPEVFFKERPAVVPNIWKIMDPGFKFRAFLETPLRKIKRRLL